MEEDGVSLEAQVANARWCGLMISPARSLLAALGCGLPPGAEAAQTRRADADTYPIIPTTTVLTFS